MAAAAITFPEGTDFVQRFTIRDSSGVVDLTGATFTFSVFPLGTSKVGAQTPTFTKTLGSGITVTSAVGGILEVAFTPANTVDLVGTHEWELEIVESGGGTFLAGFGALIVTPARFLDN